MIEKYFITGTGTGIGKTFVTAALCRELIAQGKKVVALKPVISGYDEAESDSALILEACGLAVTSENNDKISPWRFKAPLSPDMAAAKEGRNIILNEVVGFCEAQRSADILLVEGVGGVCVPLNDKQTVLDWMKALHDWKIILVAGSYLGSISHTITAFKALESSGLKLQTLILNESEGSDVSVHDTIKTLKNFLPEYVSIKMIKRNQQGGIGL